MRNWRFRRYPQLLALAVLFAISAAGSAWAANPASSHYQVSESQFGSNSSKESCSGQYCARASIGTTGGETADSGGSATFGSITSDEPLLEVIVTPGDSNLGDLDTSHTATKTMSVKVRSYLSDGYIMQMVGSPPKYGSHALNTPTTPTASTPGNEQFAVNAVANTSPGIGANPAQIPSSQFSFGVVNDDYKTPNLFKYVSGDTVAHSPTASGETDYTISMIVNVSNATPAGHYSGDFSAVVVPVY